MIKSTLISITRSIVAAFLLAVPTCLVAQNYQPKSYYTFEGSSPMKDSMGTFNLDPNYYQSNYQILTNTSGGVGKYMKLDSSSTIIRGGVLAIDSAVTFEFIFKPGMNFGTTVFAKRMDGALELRMTYPAINFMTEVKAANGSPIYDDFEIDLNGIGRASYSYYVDDNWHHIVFKYNAKAGIKEVWVDGQLPAGFSKTIASGSFAQSGNRDYMLNSQADYYKYQGAIDEIAVYYNSLGGNSIYAHYLNFMAGKHYSFANPTVTAPSPSPVTAGININDFAPGHPSPSLTPIEQLKNFPTPRYKPGHTLFPNNPFVGYYYLSGYQTYETVYSKAVANSVTLQTDFAKNFNYTIMAAENTGAYSDYTNPSTFSYAWINLANSLPQYKASALSYWPQLRPTDAGYKSNTAYATCGCLPDKYYLKNSSGQYLNPNGGTGSTKYLSPAGAPDSLVKDGLTQKFYFDQLLKKLSRPLDYILDNGEVVPFLYYTNVMQSDPSVVADKNSSGLDWFTYEGRRAATKIKAYRDQFMGLSGLSNTKFAYYQLDGQPTWNLKWSEVRTVNSAMNGSNYATGDIYMRWPSNWRYWSGAWKGWQWVVESRREQLLAGDKYFSPAVSPGWDNDETQNVRPAQWLGFLKAVSMTGAEFFTTGYFVTSQPYQNPKNYIWQLVIPPYAQAITSRYEDLFRNGYLMSGDVPNSTTSPTYMAYSFNTGDPGKLVVVRKHNSQNKYAITGSSQPMSNMAGAAPDEAVAQINLDGSRIKFKIRRQGSTYIYDNTNTSAPIFYQLDGWHENTYPYYWSKDFKFEAELYDNSNNNVYLKTTRPSGATAGDFTDYTTAVGFNSVSDLTYNFQPRSTTNYTYYVWVRARSKNSQTTGMTISLDGSNSKQIGCITDANWQWYKYDVNSGAVISFSSVASLEDHVLKITPTNTNLEIDQIHLSTSSNAIYTSPAPCSGVAVPTITASGPTAFCAGGNVNLIASTGLSYLWSNGSTDPYINVTSAGSYVVTVTTAAGSAASAPVLVTVYPTPNATITAGGSTSFCVGGSVTLTANSGSTYLWSSGATTQSITAIGGGNYNVIVTNSNGCSAMSASTTVTVKPVPSATISPSGPTTFAAGGSVTLTSSSAGTGGSYKWSPGGMTTQAVTVSTTGNYVVTVTNNSGCSATSAPLSVTVTSGAPTPKITANGPTTFCQGGSVVLTCSAANSYLWSNGATTQSITVTTAGSYTCTATTAGGSATAAAVNVIVTTPTQATITASGSTSFCSGGSVTLNASTGTSYLWSTGATTNTITTSSPGTYTVTITNNGCQSTTSKAVTVYSLPNATITANGSTNLQQGGSVQLTSSSAGSGGSYLWSTGATTQSITVSAPGNYTVKVTNSNGCSNTSAPIAVTVNSSFQPNITVSGSLSFCSGGKVTLTATKGSAYQWSTGATTRKITVTTSGNYAVTVTQFTTGYVGTSSTVNVNVMPAPSATITANGSTTICQGSSVTLTSSNGANYLWSNGATSQSISASAAGNYIVTVTGSNGCTKSSSATSVVVNNCSSSCPTPGNLHVTNLRPTSVEINWNLVSANNYYIKIENLNTGYVYYSNALSSGVNSITIGALASTPYRWSVRALCGSTYSSWSAYNYFTTPSARMGEGNSNAGLNITPLTTQMPSEFNEEQPLRLESDDASVTFFPNPATSFVTFNVTASENNTASLTLLDLSGRTLKKENYQFNEGLNNGKIDVSNYARGVYMIQLVFDGKTVMKKVVLE
ncbi:MAG: T9SS type A sorting domain-containing protein [Bacteroidia bacterium]